MTGAAKEPKSNRQVMTIIGNAIQEETIRKELLHFKLQEEFMLSPSCLKSLVVSVKPCNKKIFAPDVVPSAISNLKPKSISREASRYQTTSQAYGKDTSVLLRQGDGRFFHPKFSTEITKTYGIGGFSKPAEGPKK